MPDVHSSDRCRWCGLRVVGRHASPMECIDALRSRIADLEFGQEQRQKPNDRGPSNRGGRRDRSDARMVVLDGRRVCLTEAARLIGISASALHFRILRRVRDPHYQDVDLRACGAADLSSPAK